MFRSASSRLVSCRGLASNATKKLTIGLIPGDGIGKEVITAGKQVLENLNPKHGLSFDFIDLQSGFQTFLYTGKA